MTTTDEIRILPNHDGGENTRIELLIDGTPVSWCWIVPMTLRIGRAVVRMDGIGGVGTGETKRNRGYSSRVLVAAVEEMKRGDAPLTTLYGIPDYYPRWGYATIGHEGDHRLVRLDADNVLPEGFSWRFATPADLPGIRALYDEQAPLATGAAVRGPATPSSTQLAKSVETDDKSCVVVIDDRDDVVAYAWMAGYIWWMERVAKPRDPDALLIGEAFADGSVAADALLAALKQWATELEKPHVAIHQPPIGDLGLAARLQDVEFHGRSFRAAQFMGRSTGIGGLMTALAPELSARWLGSRSPWTGSLLIRTPEDEVLLGIDRGGVRVLDDLAGSDATLIELTVGDVARLAFGAFPPRDLLARLGISDDVADVLAHLFPEGHPYIYPADRF
ncbi:MAG TPA: GNAT family N-acetyltransferase [Thermomicrobiales bacterium]|nr:GNAT family N-acetyltransferase [Thermomicrobiales bacterium]